MSFCKQCRTSLLLVLIVLLSAGCVEPVLNRPLLDAQVAGESTEVDAVSAPDPVSEPAAPSGAALDHPFTGTQIVPPAAAFDITGVDGEGTPFRLSEHQGEYTLVNFGYTFCPDICPLTLSDLARFYRELEEQNAALAAQVNVVFVSVDPERDTPEVLDAYTNAFHESFYGIHVADEATLEAIKEGYRVTSSKRPAAGNADHYFVDHSTGIYVVDRDGNIPLFFSYDTEPAQILADMTYLLQY
jgi:protein SCO1